MNLNHQKRYNQDIHQWLLKIYRFTSKIDKSLLQKRSCPLCKSSDSTWFANNGTLDYEKCKKCSLVFMNPALSAEIINTGFKGNNQLLKDYFRIVQRYQKRPLKPINPMKDNQLCDIYQLKRSGSLLDVGCSIGTFLHKAKYFYDVEGLEVNPYTTAVAKKYFQVYTDFLPHLKLPRIYDIVTLHQILYGVPDPVELLREIRKILKNNGILYINSPNADSYAMNLYKGSCNHLYGYTTQYVFNKKSLSKLAAMTGYKIISFRTEWLDIYTPDILQYVTNPLRFIHKRNTDTPNYENIIKVEDKLHSKFYSDLGDKGNYLVAVLLRN